MALDGHVHTAVFLVGVANKSTGTVRSVGGSLAGGVWERMDTVCGWLSPLLFIQPLLHY